MHRLGGVFIADEVQFGFARTGETVWGFDGATKTADVLPTRCESDMY